MFGKTTDSSLWSGFERPPRRVRTGVLADADGVETWLASLIESLASEEVEIGDLFLLPARPAAHDKPLPWLFRRFNTWSRAGAEDPFKPSNRLPASVQRHCLTGGEGDGLSPEDRARITARGLDVLLCATVLPLTGDCAHLAKLGVLSLFLGEPEFASCRPPCWREVYEGRGVTRVFLLVHNERFERGQVVESFATGTEQSLRFTLNQSTPIKGAGLALARTLTGAAARETTLPGAEEITLSSVQPRWPSTMETLGFICRKLSRSAVLRLKARGKSRRWFIGIRRTPGPVDFQNPWRGEPFLNVMGPPGHYYADPFIVESGSRNWLFFEDWVDRNGRGRLACMEIRADGGFGEPVVILDKPYHLSYPHVFSHGGDFFMIPETCENANVQLYRATRFPFEWKLEAVLMEEAALVDTTPLHYGGNWYFFTSTARLPEEALLFTSSRIDGPWKHHPASPVSTDTRRLRGAGAIFPLGNALIRPAQDCSRGYGYAVAFNEIRRLSPFEYEERQVGKLLPTWSPGLIGAHTFNFNSKYQVVDGEKLMPQKE